MRILLILMSLICFLFSCKRELTLEEKEKKKNDSIDAIYLAMGMNVDSTFSILKYQRDWQNYLIHLQNTNTVNELIFENTDFDYNTLIFVNDSVVFYYYNPFPYDGMCGTEGLKNYENKKLLEHFQVSENNFKKINSDSLIQFVNTLDFKNKFDERYSTSLHLAMLNDQIKSRTFFKLRKFLNENNKIYHIRPVSTRERLVTEAFINNTADDFSKLNWDSIYKTDFIRFHPYEK